MSTLQVLQAIAVPLLVAVITVTPAILGLRKFRSENSNQHTETALSLSLLLQSINQVDGKISRVESKVDKHLGEHEASLGKVANFRRNGIK
jgi:hypothetical protein